MVDFTKTLLLATLLTATLLSMTACGDSENEVSQTSIQIKDDAGNIITLDKPATRVIGLAPHVIENLYSAGAGKQLIAGSDYADFPEAASKLPKVSGYNTFNLEMIASLEPDLVVAWQSGTPDHVVSKIKQLGIPVYLDEPSTMEHIADSVRRLGKLTGNEGVANKAADTHLDKIQTLRDTHSGKTPLKVFYQVWSDPIYTINGKQMISDVIALCGGVNIFASEKIKAPIVSLEAIIDRDPDVIMTGSKTQTASQALSDWYKWSKVSAVKGENLFVVNPDVVSRHTMRIIQGAEEVCEKLDIARHNKM